MAYLVIVLIFQEYNGPAVVWFPIVLAVAVACSESWNWNPKEKKKKKISQFNRFTWLIVSPYDQSAVKMQGGRGKTSVPFAGRMVLDCFSMLWNHGVRQWLLKLWIYKKPQRWVLCGPPVHLPRAHGLPEIAPSGTADLCHRPLCHLLKFWASTRHEPVQWQRSTKSSLAS